MQDIKDGSSKENMVNIHTEVRFFGKIGPFSNFQFQEELMSKLPHVSYRKKTTIILLQVDIFKITPTGRSQKRVIKKHTLCTSRSSCILIVTSKNTACLVTKFTHVDYSGKCNKYSRTL